jgi:hypothetical protein
LDLQQEHGPARPNAALVKGPKTLNDLLQEYQHGIVGNLPAKYCNGRERGRAKSHYSQRNLVWTVIKDLVMGGLDADVAIDRIYQAYGYNKSVTYIINQMMKDRSNAGGKNTI